MMSAWKKNCSCSLSRVLYLSLSGEASIQGNKFIQKMTRLTGQRQVHEPEQCSSVSLIQVNAGCEVGCQYGGWTLTHWHGPVPVVADMTSYDMIWDGGVR
jgi:hypothetical protein